MHTNKTPFTDNAILEKNGIALLLSLAVFAIVSVVFPADHGMWVDETSSFFFASLPMAEFIEHLAKAEANMSLYYAALKLYMLTGQDSALYLRSLSVVFGLLAILCMYLFSRDCISKQVALWVALIAAFNPFIYKYFWEVRSYSLVLLFGALYLWLFWLAIENNQRKYWILYGLVAGLGLYSHIFLALLIVAQFTFALIICVLRANFSTYFLHLLMAGTILTLIAAPLLYFFIIVGTDASNIDWIEIVGISHSWGMLENIYKSKYSYDKLPVLLSSLLLLACFLGSALIVVQHLVQNKLANSRALLIFYLGMCTAVPVILAIGLQYLKPMFVERYLIFITPAFLILNCVLIASLANSWVRLLALGALCITQAYGLAETHAREKFDFSSLYNDLSDSCQPGSQLVFANASVATTWLYYRDSLPKLEQCLEHIFPEQLSYRNFYQILEFDELPTLASGQTAWVVLGHVTDSERSIHRVVDTEALAQQGYKRMFFKEYPIKLALVGLQRRDGAQP